MTRRSIYGKTWLRSENGNAAMIHRAVTRAANFVVPELMSSLTAVEPLQPFGPLKRESEIGNIFICGSKPPRESRESKYSLSISGDRKVAMIMRV